MRTELVIVSAADRAALVQEIHRLIAYLDRVPDVALVDVAYTCALRKGPARLAVVADSVASLRARLASAVSRIADAKTVRVRDKSGTYFFAEPLLGDGVGRLAFVYPGVPGFYPDMLRDLVIEFDACRSAFDELEEAMAGKDDFSPSNFVFPPASYYRHDADIFSSGAYAQALVATYAGSVALTRVLSRSGIEPDGVVGLAGGDLAAMVQSGAVGAARTRPERVAAIRDIYEIVDKAVSHGGLPKRLMMTVLLKRGEDMERLQELLNGFDPVAVILALDLSPRQKIYAVAEAAAEAFERGLAGAGFRVIRMLLDRPFNTPLAESMVPEIQKFATKWLREDPAIESYSCATAGRIPESIRAARKDVAGRWSSPVRFRETVLAMHADGFRVFLEVGPRGLMTTCVEDTLKDLPHAAIAMNSIHRRGILQAQHALAQLASLGASLDLAWIYERRNANRLDFDSALGGGAVRRESEMRLTRAFPKLTLLSLDTIRGAGLLAEPKGRGAKVAARAAAIAAKTRRQRQFDFGAGNPLVSDADILAQTPGISVELRKTFRISDMPFVGDFAIGTSQLSYADPNLRGLVLLTIPLAMEIMGEAAAMLVPGRVLVAVADVSSYRSVAFSRGALALCVKAERTASGNPDEVAVKVLIREDAAGAEYTRPLTEATFLLAKEYPPASAEHHDPLANPRSVHWSSRDIYPARVCAGRRLRGVRFVEYWCESGIDYEVEVPPLADNVLFTRFPQWVVNPVLIGAITGGFALWRSHERFVGAYSFPFHLRRLDFLAPLPSEGAKVKCYLRLTGVTPKSHLCDIMVTDGDGGAVMRLSGWEERTERVNPEYRELIMQPATSFITKSFAKGLIGEGSVDVASAYVTDPPYPLFERNDEVWLKAFSHVVLSAEERRAFATKTGSAARRTEWLFGRIVAKEAVRRYVKDKYQARWSDADVVVYPDASGKPHVLGAWNDSLREKIDIAISHTSAFIVAVAAANARVGVDVESTGRDLSAEFTAGVFTPEELQIAADTANSSHAIIRFWCAKEAVSKALGTGIRFSPKEMRVVRYDADAGAVAMQLEGEWVKAFPQFTGKEISVTVRNQNDHALAFCFIPAALFKDES